MEDSPSTLFRRRRKMSLADLGQKLGLKSRGYVSDLERGRQPWPISIAYKYELISEGEITVAMLRPDLASLTAAEAQP